MMLKDSRCSRLKLLSRRPDAKDIVRLSTVDRFQGDEEDIVIASLVVDENSKTGFGKSGALMAHLHLVERNSKYLNIRWFLVKIVNRLVVLLSRARLGLYVLGNIGYFESNGIPKHWGTTFERLQLKADDDSADAGNEEAFDAARTGPRLPLCCPVHRNVRAYATSASTLQRSFCKESCQHVLQCGHTCSLDCHWPQKQHNQSASRRN